MTVRELSALLKSLDPNMRVFSEVKTANKSVQGVQVVPDGKTKSKVVLK